MAMRKAKTTRRTKLVSKKATLKKGDRLCTFCGKSHHDVKKLIAGPGVYICDECVDICNGIISDKKKQSEEWKGWDSMSDADLLAMLPGNLRSAEHIREGLQTKINELRNREVSWAKIGKTLNMSRQAAWERFS